MHHSIDELPTVSARAACVACGAAAPWDALSCEGCGGLLEILSPPPATTGKALRERFDARRASRDPLDASGVWRFRELVAPDLPAALAVTLREGRTPLYESRALGRYVGLAGPLLLKHEGMNPTGSFKDRGMTVGATVARALGRRAVACASTGNTSSSMAAYAAQAGMAALVFVPAGKVSLGKLAQTAALSGLVVEIPGSFDDALRAVETACKALGIYLLNSVNPWRIEGQKAIGLELLDDLDFAPPDVIALPAGNLGNTSALGKALAEAQAANLIAKMPRIVAVQAAGAAPFHRMMARGEAAIVPEARPETVATAIRIGDPRSWRKALRALRDTDGLTAAVTDDEILEAKAAVDGAGIGCEPASAASVAGVRQLVARGVIRREARVVCVLTGHVLKDTDAVTATFARTDLARRPRAPVRAPSEPAALVDTVGRVVEERLRELAEEGA